MAPRRRPVASHPGPSDRAACRQRLAHGLSGGGLSSGRQHREHCRDHPRQERHRLAGQAGVARSPGRGQRGSDHARWLAGGLVMISGTAFWFASRATGVISLILFSIVAILGILVNRQGRLPGLPRFAAVSYTHLTLPTNREVYI